MRNVFFALLIANLLYFAWAHGVAAPRPAPVNGALAKLPRLKLTDQAPPSRPPPAAADKTALAEPAVCMSVGPFADLSKSARAAAVLRQKGFDPRQRAESGQTSQGYWVFVGGLTTQADADHALVVLERHNIKDALVMPETPAAGRRLSLGLYSERARAERRAQAVREAGLAPEIAERKVPGTLYWVDLSAQPGMTTLPIEGLFADAVGSRIAVQPCPAKAEPATARQVAAPEAPNAAAPAAAASPRAETPQLRRTRPPATASAPQTAGTPRLR